MANYYTDHPEIEFHLDHPLMKRIVELKEKGYADKDQFADAPVCYEDAIENYKRVLDITGDVAANIIEALYADFAQIRHVKCRVSKLAPPLGGKLEKVSVVLER